MKKIAKVLILCGVFGNFGIVGDVSASSMASFSLNNETVNINASPSATSSSISTGSHTATIKTDCASGYKIYVSMANGKNQQLHLSGDTDNDTSGTNAIGPTLSSIANLSTGSATTLGTNTWGVRVGSGDGTSAFAAIPTYAGINTINQSSNPAALITSSSATSSTSGSSYTITYGANVSSSLTPGEYSGNVLYTAIMDGSCYASTVTLEKDEHVESVSGVTSGETYPIGSTQTVACTPDRIYSCSWYNGTTQVSTGSSYTFTVPEGGLTLTAKSTKNPVDAIEVQYTNNGQTTVRSALDDLYSRLN